MFSRLDYKPFLQFLFKHKWTKAIQKHEILDAMWTFYPQHRDYVNTSTILFLLHTRLNAYKCTAKLFFPLLVRRKARRSFRKFHPHRCETQLTLAQIFPPSGFSFSVVYFARKWERIFFFPNEYQFSHYVCYAWYWFPQMKTIPLQTEQTCSSKCRWSEWNASGGIFFSV